MKKISSDHVLTLHSMVIKQSGGIDEIRDNGLIASLCFYHELCGMYYEM